MHALLNDGGEQLWTIELNLFILNGRIECSGIARVRNPITGSLIPFHIDRPIFRYNLLSGKIPTWDKNCIAIWVEMIVH